MVPDLTPKVSQQTVGIVELLMMVISVLKELEAPVPLPLFLSDVSWGSVLGTP